MMLRHGIMMLHIKIPCWLGRVQTRLTLLSLRHGIVNCPLSIVNYWTLRISCARPQTSAASSLA